MPALTIITVIAVWEAAVRLLVVPEYILPGPSGISMVFVEDWRYLLLHTWVTVYEIILGFVFAIVVGIPTAMLIVYSPLVERTLYPLLVASQSVPKIALAPLLIFWVGIGTFPKVLIAFLVALLPIIIDTVAGLRATGPEMVFLARSMGAGELKIFFKIRIQTALPNIFAGIKMAVTLAVVGAIVGEFIQADRGLGYVLLQATGVLDTRLSFAAIIILGTIGVGMFVLVEVVERKLIPWHPSRRLQLAVGTP